MATLRKGLIKFAGQDVTVVGDDLAIGQKAPEFTAHAKDWSIFNGLANTQGKVRIIASLPSLDTSVCDRETRRFNEDASSLGEDVVVLILSTDLPYAQRRWCGAAGVERVITLSDHKDVNFGEKYGVLMQEQRLLRRAVFVVNRHDQIVYVAYMAALSEEPNYAAVLTAARESL